MAIRLDRLLNVARALREAPDPKKFTMLFFGHGPDDENACATPACALGHYAARVDLQDSFRLGEYGGLELADGMPSTVRVECAHFGIDEGQWCELFDSTGCGVAKTATAAAEYIENFVRNHPENGHA